MRKTIAYLLLALSALAWGAILALPFFGVSWSKMALLATLLVIVGEGGFLLAAALLGKDILAKARECLQRRRL